MSDFSDLESTSDVGAQPEVQETKDVDAGDGDGVNDFDEAYNSEMNGQEQEFEYPENGDSGENTDNGEEYDTQQAVDNATSEFDESVDNDSNTDGTGMADGQAGQDAGVMQDDSESEELSTVDYADATCNDFESELEDDESPTETAESDDTLDDSDEVNTADSKMEKNSEDTVEVDDTDGEQTDNVDVTTEDTGETNTDVSDEENLSDDEAEDSTDTTGEVNDVDRETTDNEDAITEDADETSTDASVEANTEESEAEDSTDVTGEVNDVDRETTDNEDAITEDAVETNTVASDEVNTEESEAEDSADATGESDDIDGETTDNEDAITENAVETNTDASDEVNAEESEAEDIEDVTGEADDIDGETTENVDAITENAGETNTDASDEVNTKESEAEDSTDATGEADDVDGEAADNTDDTTEDTGETNVDASNELNTTESETEDSTVATGEVNDVDGEITDNADASNEVNSVESETTGNTDTIDATTEAIGETDAVNVEENEAEDNSDASIKTEDAVNEGTDSSDKVDASSDGEATDGDNNAEKNAHYENASYSQGQNQYGYLGTCGPTSVSNSLNRVTGTDQYTENKVLTNAVDNNLCYKSDNPNSSGGTGTKEVVQLIDNVKSPESNIHTEVYEYDKALSVNELADRIKEPGTVAMVGVDSATLWDQRGDVSNSGLFQTSEYSDHWITVDSPTYEEDGNLTGFNVIDSGGGVDFVDKNKFESMYMGDANHSIKDPTALIISNEGDAVSKYSAPEGIEKTVNYKGSAMPSDGGDSPLKYSTEGKTNSEIEIINAEAADLGTENTWKEFCNDEQNQKIYDTLDEAKGGYEKLLGPEPSPWPDGYEPEIKEIPVGTRFEMAMAPGQPDDRPGGFGTMSTIEDKEYVRDKLAVKEDWKPDIDRVNTYEIVKPMQANVGPVGPQVDIPADRYLHGGADQLEMRVNPRDRMEYIRLVESREVK